MIKILLVAGVLLSTVLPALGQRSCGYGFWRVGETCVNKAGKVCTITNIQGGRAHRRCY